MGTPVRLCVCDDASVLCVPVHFHAEVINNAIHIPTDDVGELVSALYASDDELQAATDMVGDADSER